MIVVDVGCAKYGGDYSIERLIEEFQPDTLYGFDPAADFPHMLWDEAGTTVTIERAAAWLYDGEIGFQIAGLGGRIAGDGVQVKCVDLARFIAELPDDEIVLKLDAEGAEYQLLDHLIVQDLDQRLKLAWVEWHVADDPGGARRRSIEERIRCELVEWRW